MYNWYVIPDPYPQLQNNELENSIKRIKIKQPNLIFILNTLNATYYNEKKNKKVFDTELALLIFIKTICNDDSC